MSINDDTNPALEMLGRIGDIAWNTTLANGHVTLFELRRDASWQTQWLLVEVDRWREVKWTDTLLKPTDENLRVAVARLAGQDD